jgi:hypothetical protein
VDTCIKILDIKRRYFLTWSKCVEPLKYVLMGIIQSQSHVTTDGQSVSPSWCRSPSGAHDQILVTVWQLLICRCRAPPLTRGRVWPWSEAPALLQFSWVTWLLALASYLYSAGAGSPRSSLRVTYPFLFHVIAINLWMYEDAESHSRLSAPMSKAIILQYASTTAISYLES